MALTAVIQEAYTQDVSTRSIDELVKALGMSGVSKSQVSRLCGELDERVGAFLNRQIEGDWPYLWIDVTNVKTREAGRIVSVVVIVAVGVNTGGQREMLGPKVGASEAGPFWTELLRGLNRRGLRGVKLVISDSHEGIKLAASKVLRDQNPRRQLFVAWLSPAGFRLSTGPGKAANPARRSSSVFRIIAAFLMQPTIERRPATVT